MLLRVAIANRRLQARSKTIGKISREKEVRVGLCICLWWIGAIAPYPPHGRTYNPPCLWGYTFSFPYNPPCLKGNAFSFTYNSPCLGDYAFSFTYNSPSLRANAFSFTYSLPCLCDYSVNCCYNCLSCSNNTATQRINCRNS